MTVSSGAIDVAFTRHYSSIKMDDAARIFYIGFGWG